MTLNPNEDTEFNDALRKHGILPALPPKSRSPSPVLKTKEEEYDEMLDDELRELAEEADEETERYLERLRKQREAEAKKERELGRFGRVYPIGRDDYTREVTEASMENEPGEGVQAEDEDLEDDDRKGDEGKPKKGLGTGVVCFLYKDGIPRSDLAKRHVEILAARHPRTKFVSIVGDKCIPNLPDERIPMFLVYRAGELVNQLVSWGKDRERRIEELEALLIVAGAIIPPKRLPKGNDSDVDSDSDESERGERRMKSAATSTNTRTQKNIRSTARDDDDDSDFDL
ncbi:thioredoxin-like protein [Schizophyllum commune Tattone D]|nr:thioredoxin-like protein [Schizophyllum commune Tattone D]